MVFNENELYKHIVSNPDATNSEVANYKEVTKETKKKKGHFQQ